MVDIYIYIYIQSTNPEMNSTPNLHQSTGRTLRHTPSVSGVQAKADKFVKERAVHYRHLQAQTNLKYLIEYEGKTKECNPQEYETDEVGEIISINSQILRDILEKIIAMASDSDREFLTSISKSNTSLAIIHHDDPHDVEADHQESLFTIVSMLEALSRAKTGQHTSAAGVRR